MPALAEVLDSLYARGRAQPRPAWPGPDIFAAPAASGAMSAAGPGSSAVSKGMLQVLRAVALPSPNRDGAGPRPLLRVSPNGYTAVTEPTWDEPRHAQRFGPREGNGHGHFEATTRWLPAADRRNPIGRVTRC